MANVGSAPKIAITISNRVRIDNLLAEAQAAWNAGNASRCADLTEQAVGLLKTLTNEKATVAAVAQSA